MSSLKNKPLKIGITGATGFIGSYLLNYLISKKPKNKYVALTRNYNLPTNLEKLNIEWQIGDLTSESVCQSFIKNLDTIIYLAHVNTPLTSDKDLITDTQLNLIPLLKLLKTIEQSKKTIHIIYASSGGTIYGNPTNSKPFKETDPCLPLSSYGIQKLIAEHYLRILSSSGIIKVTILRISNPYGVLLHKERRQGLIGIAINQAINNQLINIFSDPNTVRDYIHLQDLSNAITSCMYKNHDFKILNIGSGKGTSILEILNLIEKNIHKKINYKLVNQDNSNSPKWNVLNIEKTKKYLNWKPLITLNKGIKSLCQENIKNNIL